MSYSTASSYSHLSLIFRRHPITRDVLSMTPISSSHRCATSSTPYYVCDTHPRASVFAALWVFALALLGLAVIHGLWSCIATKVRNRKVNNANDLPSVDDIQKQKQKSRLASLDVFRGWVSSTVFHHKKKLVFW